MRVASFPAAEVALLEEWVRRGAPFPGPAAIPLAKSGIDFAAGRRFWSFQPLKLHVPPAPRDSSWAKRRVDWFLRAEMEKRNLHPSPSADKRTLLRRVNFDLIGLPPSPEEVDAFLSDTAPDAYERVVERLLASPRHGERWARFYVTPVEDGENDSEAAIVYAIETTDQRVLQRQFDQSQKMESVGKLAGGIAHDFNNVLSAIMMATDFLLNAHKPSDPSFQDIMQIKQNANRAASLVRQLLAFSRKQTMHPQVIDLGEALSDLTVLLRRLIGENVTLDVPQVRDLWSVKADVGQFEQVIINLAVNARDAMPFGGRLTLRTSNVGADASAQHRHKEMPLGEYVLVEVEDTGSGIAPEIIDKIFDPFYTTKDIGKGTGLGLSTVYGIVKQTGGFIYVDSGPGKGTSFHIFLPRHHPELEVQTDAAPTNGAARESAEARPRADLTVQGTILLVEFIARFDVRKMRSRKLYIRSVANRACQSLRILRRRRRVICSANDQTRHTLGAVRQCFPIPQDPNLRATPSLFQIKPTKLNPLPLMFHPIPPVLGGTDGKLNLHENASKPPVRKPGISNVENSDRRVCALPAPSARQFSDEGPRGRRQRLRNREAVQQPEVERWLRRTASRIDRDELAVFRYRNLEGCPVQSVYSTLS